MLLVAPEAKVVLLLSPWLVIWLSLANIGIALPIPSSSLRLVVEGGLVLLWRRTAAGDFGMSRGLSFIGAGSGSAVVEKSDAFSRTLPTLRRAVKGAVIDNNCRSMD